MVVLGPDNESIFTSLNNSNVDVSTLEFETHNISANDIIERWTHSLYMICISPVKLCHLDGTKEKNLKDNQETKRRRDMLMSRVHLQDPRSIAFHISHKQG
ncbi:ATP-dependent protease La domain protein [Striga asiatica]|uniref:ATP-dependent protease La domain protein n=1 Tax=Striga asiatica TaxID=4170 RepID=A0A5A7Q2U2_STRAF|nr:ATP-dependent protease La domain protein [Striga asiatica]